MPKRQNCTQTDLFAKKSHRFGGNNRKTQASRMARPVSIRQSMHLMLKSQNAKGNWSFLKPRNKAILKELIKKYSKQYGVQILSSANVGNHLHIHAKFFSHQSYKHFIRALTGAIALKVTGASKLKSFADIVGRKNARFWTQTPYTRFVFGITDFMRITDYIKVNQLESFGHPRSLAEGVVKNWDYLYDGFV